MKKRVFGVLIVSALIAAAPLLGQMGFMPPPIAGVWNPVVGTGAIYETSNGRDNQKHQLTISIVGKETVDGKDGYWQEMLMDQRGQQMVIQSLNVKDGPMLKIVKTAFQMGDKPPMFMPDMGGMMGGRGGQQPPPVADYRDKAEHVGMESITTPAGTFQADHWKSKDGTGDVWFSPTVPPWGIVKSVSKDSTMVLVKVLTDAQSHFNGKPVQFDPSVFMGPGRGE